MFLRGEKIVKPFVSSGIRGDAHLPCLSVNIVHKLPIDDRCIAEAVRPILRIPVRKLEAVYLPICILAIYLGACR